MSKRQLFVHHEVGTNIIPAVKKIVCEHDFIKYAGNLLPEVILRTYTISLFHLHYLSTRIRSICPALRERLRGVELQSLTC